MFKTLTASTLPRKEKAQEARLRCSRENAASSSHGQLSPALSNNISQIRTLGDTIHSTELVPGQKIFSSVDCSKILTTAQLLAEQRAASMQEAFRTRCATSCTPRQHRHRTGAAAPRSHTFQRHGRKQATYLRARAVNTVRVNAGGTSSDHVSQSHQCCGAQKLTREEQKHQVTADTPTFRASGPRGAESATTGSSLGATCRNCGRPAPSVIIIIIPGSRTDAAVAPAAVVPIASPTPGALQTPGAHPARDTLTAPAGPPRLANVSSPAAPGAGTRAATGAAAATAPTRAGVELVDDTNSAS